MATKSLLSSFIALLHGDRAATLTQAGEAFAGDFGHFARSNNREPLNEAVKTLKSSPKDKALSEAISQGYKAANLVTGYIGAQSGKWLAQSDDTRAPYEAAIVLAIDAFAAYLEASEAFADKTPKSADDKAKAKEAKADKAKEATNSLITELVKNGELVRAVDVKTIDDMSTSLLLETLAGRTLSLGNMAELRAMTAKAEAMAKAEADALAVAEAEALAMADALAMAEAEALAVAAKAAKAEAAKAAKAAKSEALAMA